ncbi:MAG TPA: PH domain-containing protein [Phycicoccus sp.]|nr:PH domain-containing protein [Phycicoccus sp.]
MARRPRIDRELARYLVDGERAIVAVRRHWFHLSKEILLVVGAAAFAMWLDVNTPSNSGGQTLRSASLLLFWGSLLWLVWRVLNWRHEWFVATDKRFLLFYGFIRRRVAMMPLLKVTDMTYDRSLLGRIVGYGTFVLESAGNDQALSEIDHVPDADEHYRAICTMLFGPNSQVRFPPGYGPGPEGPPGDGGPEGGSGGGPGGSGGSGDGGDDSTGPAVIVGPGDGPVRVSRRGHPPGPGHQPESWYRSSNLRGPSRLGDTGEIPVVRVPPEGRRDVPLYPPAEWLDD